MNPYNTTPEPVRVESAPAQVREAEQILACYETPLTLAYSPGVADNSHAERKIAKRSKTP